MKKKLNFNKKENKYFIESGDICIEIIEKKISMEEVYNKIYSNVSFDDDECKIELETELLEKEDKIIFRQLQQLFSKIDNEINQYLKK